VNRAAAAAAAAAAKNSTVSGLHRCLTSIHDRRQWIENRAAKCEI